MDLKTAMGLVSPAEVDAEPDVVTARAALERANAMHADSSRQLSRYLALPAAIAENERLARAELEACRAALAGICGRVLAGTATESEELQCMVQIERAERVVRRCELGRPAIEQMITTLKSGIVTKAGAVERAEEALDAARATAREQLARELV